MDLTSSASSNFLGLGFIAIFFVLMVVFAIAGRKRYMRVDYVEDLRPIQSFNKLSRAVGLAVEAGRRLHLSLGRGEINSARGASALAGLSMLQGIARAASISDRPPVATSGEGTLSILSQDTLRSFYRTSGISAHFNPLNGQLTGLTPFSYAAGTSLVISDMQVSASVLSGHFGSEVALITDAAERSGSLTLAGSDSVPAQAVLYATAQEPLIGEELFAAGAYMRAGPLHIASLQAQDVLRWVLVVVILASVALKLIGLL